MVILFLLFRQSLQEDFNLALQDLSDDPLTVTDWYVSRKGILNSYSSMVQQCNQNLLQLTPYPNIYQKTFDIPHFEFDQLTIEMDVYFIHFSQSFLRIKIDSQTIFQQTFSTENLQQNNVCGSVDSQYTISENFYLQNKQIELVIFYEATSSDSYIGIRNLNIYSNGYQLSNGCTMELPYLQDDTCVQFCTNSNPYLGGDDMLVCQSDETGDSQLIGTIETTQTNVWQFSDPNPTNWQLQYLTQDRYLRKKDIYNNIMFTPLFSSGLTCNQLCYYITQNIDETYLLQITLVFYILEDWDDGSYVGIYIQGDTIYSNNMVIVYKQKGKYYCTKGSKFHFTNLTQSSSLSTFKARRTLITFQGQFYSSTVQIGFSQQIQGDGSYGLGNIYIYQSQKDPNIDQSGLYGFPYQCVMDFFAYNGYCVQNCPPYSFKDNTNNNCTDLQQQQSSIFKSNYQQSNRWGQYIIKDFYDNNFNQDTINSIFPLIPPTLNNYQNGQPFSFVGNKKILGGFNSWGSGSYGIQQELPIHNQIRIYFKLYLIDNWQNGDVFKFAIDTSQSFSFYQNNPNQQLQGHSAYDQLINVEQLIVHTSQQLKIIFQCQIQSKNSSIASCGMSDLFVLYDQYVDVLCNQTNLYFSYFTNNCEQCEGTNCFLYPTNYYLNDLSDKAFFGCQQRDQSAPNECLTCSAPSYQLKQSGGICECVNKFIYSDYQCTPCHYSCDTCSGPSQNECLTCVPTRQLIGQTCQCYPIFYDVYPVSTTCFQIKDNQNQYCDYTCKTCFAQKNYHCVTCPDNSFRTLNSYNSCVCNQQYMDVGSPICQQIICDSSCLTCYGILQQNCLTCQANFRLDKGYCICDGQYNNLVNKSICIQNDLNCNDSFCQSQQSLQGFLDCYPSLHRCLKIKNTQQQQCVCFDGYFEQQGVCIQCHKTCLTCENTERTCLTCDQAINRSLNINQCNCSVGYNDKLAPDEPCVLNYIGCHYSCLECFGPDDNQCLTCKALRVQQGSTCPCLPLKYDNSNSQSCEACNYSCLTCNGYQINNCLSCDQQLSRELSQNQCICQQGYYDMQGICNQCHYSCLSCNSAESQSCIDCDISNFRVINNNHQCNCIVGYVDIGNPKCQICPNECKDCDSQLKCISCKNDKQILNVSGRCDCIQGYQKDNDGACFNCQSDLGKALYSCQYKNAQDGVWTYGEQCDDGNNDSRDGCVSFQITPNYSCVNIFNQPSICYKCPQNCLSCQLQSDQIVCISCDQNYYNAESECRQCHEESCLECIKPSYCSVCMNQKIPINGICNSCDYGFYYDGQQCESQCGDGIKTINEQCDDGNVQSNDGCSEECRIENNFVCHTINNQSSCFINEKPQLVLTVPYQKSSDVKQLIITISQAVTYQDVQVILQKSKQIQVQFQVSGNNTLTIDLKLTFQQSYEQITLNLTINGTILNKYNQTLQSNQLQIILTNILVLDDDQKQQSEQISKITQNVVISSSCLSVTSLLMGGASSFIQLLNLISQLQYIQFIDINIPQNLVQFLNKFNGFTISPVFQTLQVDLTYEKPSQEIFVYNDINAYFLANVKGFLLGLLTSFILYLICKATIHFLQHFKQSQLKRGNLTIYSYNKCNRIIFFLLKFSQNIKQLTFTQLILSSCYDIQFAIFLQINNPYMENIDQLLNFIFAFFTLIYLCYFMFNKINDEEIKNGNQYNQLKLFQSQMFTFAIVFLQDFPQSQILLISISSLIISLYVFKVQPFKNSFNNHKLIIQESILFVSIITFIAYVYFPSEINPVLLGWFHITNIGLIILGSLAIDIYQYLIMIKKMY